MQYIIIIGAFQALVALWLLAGKKKVLSNYLFIFLLSAIAVHLIIKFIIFSFIPDESIRHQMNTFIGACYGPLIYLYTLSKTKKEFSVVSKWYTFIPLFILMIGYLTVSCVFFVLAHVDQKLLDLYNNFSLIVLFTVNLYYPLKSIALLSENQFKTFQKHEYEVIIRISFCILFMELALVISKILLKIYPEDLSLITVVIRTLVYFLLLVICLLIIGKSLRSESTDLSEIKSENNLDIPLRINDSSENTSMTRVDYELKFGELWHRMDLSVRQKQLFRDCDLNLDQLAVKTGINKYQISEMLNGYRRKPFYRYINEYRIEYFKDLVKMAIKKNENINFLSFAYEAGFKSKSSFNRYFKEITGKTPSQFYKNIINQASIELIVN